MNPTHTMRRQKDRSGGFSLIEVMLSVTIGVMIIGAVCVSFLQMTKACYAVINYSEMTSAARTALAYFGRDMRMAENVQVYVDGDNRATQITVNIPSAVDGQPDVINYQFLEDTHPRREGKHVLERTHYDFNGNVIHHREVLQNVVEDGYQFVFYNTNGDPIPSQDLHIRYGEVKEIQMDAMMQKETLQTSQTDHVISARYMMRNKHVTN